MCEYLGCINEGFQELLPGKPPRENLDQVGRIQEIRQLKIGPPRGDKIHCSTRLHQGRHGPEFEEVPEWIADGTQEEFLEQVFYN